MESCGNVAATFWALTGNVLETYLQRYYSTNRDIFPVALTLRQHSYHEIWKVPWFQKPGCRNVAATFRAIRVRFSEFCTISGCDRMNEELQYICIFIFGREKTNKIFFFIYLYILVSRQGVFFPMQVFVVRALVLIIY